MPSPDCPKYRGKITRADGTDPTAAAVPCRTSKPVPLNGESNSARFAPPACGRARSAPPPASQAPSVRAGVPPLRFLGKAVPRVVVEFAAPWSFVAEFAPKKEWSGRRGSNPRRSAWEADILPLNYSRTSRLHFYSSRDRLVHSDFVDRAWLFGL